MNRTHNNGELRIEHIGQHVELIGWVAKKRNLGALVFIDLRDRYGITQVIFDESFEERLKEVKNEYILSVQGTVIERSSKNPKIPTGTIELEAKKVEVLGKTYRQLPFEIMTSKETREDVRLKYRYLDLRNKKVKDNMIFRSKVIGHLPVIFTFHYG